MVLELFLIHVCLQSSSLSVWDIWQSVAKIRKSPERDQGGREDCCSSCYNSRKDWWWCFHYLLENCRMLNACFPSLASQFQYHLTWHKKHPDWHCHQFQWSPKIFCIFLPKLSLNTWLVSWLSCSNCWWYHQLRGGGTSSPTSPLPKVWVVISNILSW